MRRIDRIICHCTATPDGRHVTVKDVDNWHRNERHWPNGIGYHWLIYLDGSIHQGRPEPWQMFRFCPALYTLAVLTPLRLSSSDVPAAGCAACSP